MATTPRTEPSPALKWIRIPVGNLFDLNLQRRKYLYDPVDGSLSQWTNWTDCPVTCGNGTILRSRNCTGRIKNTFAETIVAYSRKEAFAGQQYGGLPCQGDLEENLPCINDPCLPCIYEDAALSGRLYVSDTASTAVATAEDCQAECQLEDRCNFWQFQNTHTKCWFAESNSKYYFNEPDQISGPKFCP